MGGGARRSGCSAAQVRLKWFGGCLMDSEGVAAHVELEHAGNGDYELRPIAVLEQRELEGRRATDEQAADEAALALQHPLPAVVLADQEQGGLRTVRCECFSLAHGRLPFACVGRLVAGDIALSTIRTLGTPPSRRCAGCHEKAL